MLDDLTYLILTLQEHLKKSAIVYITLDVVWLPEVLGVNDCQSIRQRAVQLNFSPVGNDIE